MGVKIICKIIALSFKKTMFKYNMKARIIQIALRKHIVNWIFFFISKNFVQISKKVMTLKPACKFALK